MRAAHLKAIPPACDVADHYRPLLRQISDQARSGVVCQVSKGFDVTLEDTQKNTHPCLDGPDAARIVADCGASELNDLGYYKVGPAYIAEKHVRAARMSNMWVNMVGKSPV